MGGDDLLWTAVSDAVKPIAPLETQWDTDKLEKKLRDYFKKGAKGLDFYSKPWQELINEYADAVFSSIFCGLGDREWLTQADFLFCIDAGVRESFPAPLLARVPQPIFEQVVLQATDRAFDEQRYWATRWETIQKFVTGKMTQKKVREALDAARAAAVQAGPPTLDDFIGMWVDGTVRTMAETTNGDPKLCMEESSFTELMHAIVQEGGLPMNMTSELGTPPAGWPAVDTAVSQAYALYADGGGGVVPRGRKGRKAAAAWEAAAGWGGGFGGAGGYGAGAFGCGAYGGGGGAYGGGGGAYGGGGGGAWGGAGGGGGGASYAAFCKGARKGYGGWGGAEDGYAQEPPTKRWKGTNRW